MLVIEKVITMLKTDVIHCRGCVRLLERVEGLLGRYLLEAWTENHLVAS